MKKIIYFVLALVFLLCANAYAANKCTESNGQISYQDAPCGSDAKSAATVEINQGAVNSPKGTRGGVNPADPPEIQLIGLVAAFESMEVDGRACDWVLKVHGKDPEIAKCDPLLQHMKGPYVDLLEVYAKLLKEHGNVVAGRTEVNRIDRASTNILTSMKFLKARLGFK